MRLEDALKALESLENICLDDGATNRSPWGAYDTFCAHHSEQENPEVLFACDGIYRLKGDFAESIPLYKFTYGIWIDDEFTSFEDMERDGINDVESKIDQANEIYEKEERNKRRIRK